MAPKKTSQGFGFDEEVQPDGFVSELEEVNTRRLVAEQNRKKKKSGGFQSMGFSNVVYKGLVKRGYKVPTPIQRKCIPVILEGKDVVAMARTGSGKTACFLLPLLERLQVASAKSGARALILSPTRELALQTLRFTKELGRFSSLRAAAVLGGDAMEGQFSALHASPDIIVATPGRFVHVCVEMDLKLDSVEFVVFDEADRLFEMGFAEQLREILARLLDSRQTLLFSATLPSMLVEFARAGLTDPVLIRLDVESKLSDQLQLAHFRCREDERSLLLLHLLKNVIPPGQQTVVFAATKHHVEYIRQLLERAGISNTFLYSDLDPAARKINTDKFRNRRADVLIVTDLAARGIDIPHLDNVINYNFPAKPKLFVHRVGRVARAGRSGNAYSLVTPGEVPYLLDLYLFLGSKLTYTPVGKVEEGVEVNGYLGAIPQELVDQDSESIRLWHETSSDLQAARKTSQNAYKQYLKSRPAASRESVRRTKEEAGRVTLGVHPALRLAGGTTASSEALADFVTAVRNYKSSRTIFEIGATTHHEGAKVMKAKRDKDEKIIEQTSAKRQAEDEGEDDEEGDAPGPNEAVSHSQLSEPSEDVIRETFTSLVESKRKYDPSRETRKKKKKRMKLEGGGDFRDENYIPYQSKDHHTEAALTVTSAFDREANSAVLDLTMDDTEQMRRQTNRKHWDPRKKKFVGESNDGKNRKIRTESGVWIPATFQKSGKYEEWRKRSQLEAREEAAGEGQDGAGGGQPGGRRGRGGLKVLRRRHGERAPLSAAPAGGSRRPEMRSKEQILKQRRLADRRRQRSTVGVGKGKGHGRGKGKGRR